ncbi:Uridine phosphorylase 2 isoform X1 [Oopsacas minuta]|uniref:Uridine phosphorylase 2 isoform X1 n=1 Tax=Oopsacas minuta TaxID=111878 RepID=A0AAV7JB48_9METZ|nr:Uridine phosphorylase 2 isoform X1 [Oopsacas minuta]
MSEVDGSLMIPNSHLKLLPDDYLYHLGYSSAENLIDIFGDIKFVVIGGSIDRMRNFARYLSSVTGDEAVDLTKTDRYIMYKIGQTLSLSHGIGIPSMSILLHETIKLLSYIKATNTVIIRIGTSGGINVPAGSLIITNRSYNGYLEEKQELAILGQKVIRPTKLDNELAKQLQACHTDTKYDAILGGTMSTDDFYEGQARADGVLCEFSESDKLDFLKKLNELGIRNIEMECTFLAAITAICNLKCACVCVTLLDRLKGDQVLVSASEYKEFNERPQRLIAQFISQSLGSVGEKIVKPSVMFEEPEPKRKCEDKDEIIPRLAKIRREEFTNK